jgi:UDPglucose 6-dehydrogenase
VGTPMDEGDGSADLSYLFSAADEVATALAASTIIVIKSTVPVGTGRKVAEKLKEKRPDLHLDVVSNPEFLREGTAIADFLAPDRIVIGSTSTKAKEAMQRLYLRLSEQQVPLLFTSVETAELIKYASNGFLATKIAFINEMADICEQAGADIHGVDSGMGLDKRIGHNYLVPGPGFGGSCFPKDTLALTRIARDNGTISKIVEAVIQGNDKRKKNMAAKIVKACSGTVEGKTIALLGLTFKANTDDMRSSPSLVIINELLAQGANIHTYDPAGMENARQLIDHASIRWCDNAYSAAEGASALVIITEWNEFSGLDLQKLKTLLAAPVIVDLRNILNAETAVQEGFSYHSIGKGYF